MDDGSLQCNGRERSARRIVDEQRSLELGHVSCTNKPIQLFVYIAKCHFGIIINRALARFLR